MKNLTSSSNEISAGDLSASLDILEKIVTVTNNTGSTIEEDVSNVLATLLVVYNLDGFNAEDIHYTIITRNH